MTSLVHAIENAQAIATDRSPPELAGTLQELLGQKLVAFAVGDKHPKSIGRYARGERSPQDQTLARLVDLFTVATILLEGMRDTSVRTWMLGSNPRLKGKAPIEAVHEGRAYEVMAAAQAFVTRR